MFLKGVTLWTVAFYTNSVNIDGPSSFYEPEIGTFVYGSQRSMPPLFTSADKANTWAEAQSFKFKLVEMKVKE